MNGSIAFREVLVPNHNGKRDDARYVETQRHDKEGEEETAGNGLLLGRYDNAE